MSISDQYLTTRALKGAPATILIALHFHGSLFRSELAKATGYSPPTLRQAIAILEELHFLKIKEDGLHVMENIFPLVGVVDTDPSSSIEGSPTPAKKKRPASPRSTNGCLTTSQLATAELLQHAGLATHTQRVVKLLQQDLDPVYVSAWTREKAAANQGKRGTDNPNFNPGLLLWKLENQAEAPDPRCPDCLNHYPACYCDIIVR